MWQDVNAHGPLAGNNSDVEVGEVTLADMSPDDIRAELKRLYMQLEILKNKTIRADNPHISKRRGGRKVAHRRFSLQVSISFYMFELYFCFLAFCFADFFNCFQIFLMLIFTYAGVLHVTQLSLALN